MANHRVKTFNGIVWYNMVYYGWYEYIDDKLLRYFVPCRMVMCGDKRTLFSAHAGFQGL